MADLLQWLGLGRKLQAPQADPRSGIMSWHLAPGFGHCGRCRTAWKFINGHTTPYVDGSGGCFPLCELCWSEMTPQERLPFYYVLFRQWEWDAKGRELHVTWEALERAVLTEAQPA